jgi:hypothetical protein
MNVRAFSLLCVAACLFASLGADAPKEEKKKDRSPYAGTYAGTYTASNPQGDQEGEFTITVDDAGKVQGESTSKSVANGNVKIKGTILKDNKCTLIYEYENGTKANTYGTIAKTDDGGVTGTMIQRLGANAAFFIEFEAKPKAK